MQCAGVSTPRTRPPLPARDAIHGSPPTHLTASPHIHAAPSRTRGAWPRAQRNRRTRTPGGSRTGARTRSSPGCRTPRTPPARATELSGDELNHLRGDFVGAYEHIQKAVRAQCDSEAQPVGRPAVPPNQPPVSVIQPEEPGQLHRQEHHRIGRSQPLGPRSRSRPAPRNVQAAPTASFRSVTAQISCCGRGRVVRSVVAGVSDAGAGAAVSWPGVDHAWWAFYGFVVSGAAGAASCCWR